MLFDLIVPLSVLLLLVGIGGALFLTIRHRDRRELRNGALYTALAGMLGLTLPGAFFYAEPGMSYLVQYPWGTQKSVLTPGFHTRFFGEAIPFKKYLTVSFGGTGGEFTAATPSQEIRFNDSVTAQVTMTSRFEMPQDPELFHAMAVAYRSQNNLAFASLIPVMQESLRNAGRMFAAQEYIGGRGGDFENAVLDQIRNGIFLLDVQEQRMYTGERAITDEAARTIQQDQTVMLSVRVRLDKDGQELRKDAADHPLKKFGILLVQASIQNVDPDPKFKEKLHEQREAAAQVSIERQKVRQKEEEKKRIIAEGEAEKARSKIELEKAQIQKVLAAETKAKEAEQEQRERVTRAETLKREAEIERERKEVELLTARLEAERQLELATAEAKARELKMKADNALEQRLAAFVEVSKAYADAIRDKQLVPSVVVGQSGEGGLQQRAGPDRPADGAGGPGPRGGGE
jgi:regulator of protease activity HflC (stomatin/prohibitin superfamily)